MLPLVILCSGDVSSISGTYFHVYEIGLYLQDIGVDVYFGLQAYNPHIFLNRYTKNLKIFDIKDFFSLNITKYNLLFYNIYNEFIVKKIILNARNLYFLITDGALCCFETLFSKQHISKKINFILQNLQFLYDEDLPNNIVSQKFFINKPKHECSWGLYDKYYKITNEPTADYFIYARYNQQMLEMGISAFSTKEKVNAAIQYCKDNNLSYVLDTKKYYDPWNKYKGLIYTRNIDHSPRLPFEFGAANKPTMCFDTSPGLRTLAQDCTLYKFIVMKTKKKLTVPLKIFYR